MMVKLVFLGKFRALARGDLNADVPSYVATLGDLKDWIARRDPDLGAAIAGAQTQLVLNHEIMRDMAHALHDGDEVAFMPPMSGG
jgi:molybdopterin synthase sulfur carrier subunit